MRIAPTKEQINSWIKRFVPEKDLFFLREKDLKIFNDYLSEVLVIPKEEFFNHPSYGQIQFINSYMYWTISNETKYVIVAQPSWISELPKQKKKDILNIQVEIMTGLILPTSIFSSLEQIPNEYIVSKREGVDEYIKKYITNENEKFVVVRYEMWNNLPHEVKDNAIKSYAHIWDDWKGHNFPTETPHHIKKYGNKFTTVSGSNCFASTLFAITGEDWIINEWVHPETLLNGLNRAKYYLTSDEMKSGDVVTWVNSDNVVKHASYHIDNNLLFNKNGQVFFEHWKIIHFEQVNEMFSDYEIRVYRKKS